MPDQIDTGWWHRLVIGSGCIAGVGHSESVDDLPLLGSVRVRTQGTRRSRATVEQGPADGTAPAPVRILGDRDDIPPAAVVLTRLEGGQWHVRLEKVLLFQSERRGMTMATNEKPLRRWIDEQRQVDRLHGVVHRRMRADPCIALSGFHCIQRVDPAAQKAVPVLHADAEHPGEVERNERMDDGATLLQRRELPAVTVVQEGPGAGTES